MDNSSNNNKYSVLNLIYFSIWRVKILFTMKQAMGKIKCQSCQWQSHNTKLPKNKKVKDCKTTTTNTFTFFLLFSISYWFYMHFGLLLLMLVCMCLHILDRVFSVRPSSQSTMLLHKSSVQFQIFLIWAMLVLSLLSLLVLWPWISFLVFWKTLLWSHMDTQTSNVHMHTHTGAWYVRRWHSKSVLKLSFVVWAETTTTTSSTIASEVTQ